jgi:hypothetical protein
VVPTAVAVVVPPFVNVMLPLIVPEMVMDIEVTVVPAILIWPQSIATLVSSVGREKMKQLRVSVPADATPPSTVAATAMATNDRVMRFMRAGPTLTRVLFLERRLSRVKIV